MGCEDEINEQMVNVVHLCEREENGKLFDDLYATRKRLSKREINENGETESTGK